MQERSAERMMKRLVSGTTHSALVYPAPGWTDIAASEVFEALSAAAHPAGDQAVVEPTEDGIQVSGLSLRTLVELPYLLRTARELTWTIATGRVGHVSDLEALIAKQPWQLYLPPNAAVCLQTNSFGSRLYHEGLIEEVCARVLSAAGFRIADGPEAMTLVIHLAQNRARISIKCGGEPLHMRGYRAILDGTAPLPEHHAAAAIRWLLAWVQEKGETSKPTSILVPFAGSGTFGFEAAMELARLPSWLWGRRYAMTAMPCFPESSATFARRRQWEGIRLGTACPARETSVERPHLEKELNIRFCELSPTAVASLKANIAHFSHRLPETLQSQIQWEVCEQDVFTWQPEADQNGLSLVLMNPPYGLRLKSDGWGGTEPWSKLAKWLQRRAALSLQPLAGVVLIPSESAWRSFLTHLGPKAQFATRHLNHGGLDLRIVGFLFTRSS